MSLPFHDRKFQFLLIAVALALVFEILSLFDLQIPMPYAPFIYAIFIMSIGHEILWKGFKAIFQLKFSSINLLMTIAVFGAFYLGEYPEAAVVIVLYILGERLEDIGIANSKTAMEGLIQKAPKTAYVKHLHEDIYIDKVEIGSIICIKSGELIPLDGKIHLGETSIDESAITGEPIPKDKHIGDFVYAGTLNKHRYIEIETTKISADTTFSKIIRMTFEANAHKGETQQFIQKFAKYYTPMVILIAVGIFIIPVFVFHQDEKTWLNQAISLLVIACPCALVISSPVAIYAAIGNASSKGALIKGGKYLEAMSEIGAIALDKTRTITDGKPVVTDVFPLNQISREELLACTAGAEMFSEHPLANAIIEASKKEGFEPHTATGYKSIIGKGATAQCLVCANKDIYLGKMDFIREHTKAEDAQAEEIVQSLSAEGKTSIVVSFGKGIAGILGLMDQIKPEAPKAINELKEMGLRVYLLSGDHQNAADFIGKKVGIDHIYGNLLPEGKEEKIAELMKSKGGVAMAGDGINDTPAMAQSTVSIAMGAAGSDTAIEPANIALMNDQLGLIPFIIRLSKKTIQRIKINTISAISIKVLFIILAFSGYSNLVFAIAADVGVTIAVIFSSLTLMNFEQKEDTLC
ncbi:MAG: cation-translocating P-type ATPase [Bacteroidetes bacterium]|nr:cation-translocating P-type ATPase [Bacteroidota bacterium]